MLITDFVIISCISNGHWNWKSEGPKILYDVIGEWPKYFTHSVRSN